MFSIQIARKSQNSGGHREERKIVKKAPSQSEILQVYYSFSSYCLSSFTYFNGNRAFVRIGLGERVTCCVV